LLTPSPVGEGWVGGSKTI